MQISPDTPVLLAGTKADLVRSSSGNAFVDIWSTLSALLEAGRPHHFRRYATPLADELAAFTGSRPSSSCLLCCRRGVAGAPAAADVHRRTYPKSRVGGIGFVDALHSAAAIQSTAAGVQTSAARVQSSAAGVQTSAAIQRTIQSTATMQSIQMTAAIQSTAGVQCCRTTIQPTIQSAA